MKRKSQKPPREKPSTDDLLDGFGEDDRKRYEQFGDRAKNSQFRKMERTAELRAADGLTAEEIQTLPIGQVLQVFSLFYKVGHPTGNRLCVARKTLSRLSETAIVVGDEVHFRDSKAELDPDSPAQAEAVIEQVLPRRTVLTRANSFNRDRQHPIVANAQQMLIVASLIEPKVKWGLIDRMIVAAKSGGLDPIICLNKIDLAAGAADAVTEMTFAEKALAHYASLGYRCCKVSVTEKSGLEELRDLLKDKATVLAGHSGVGKSSLISAVQPGLDIRVGAVSRFTEKGIHTTTSARRYDLDFGGCVIDTPGVKM
ncbi:MAG: ribosome small subunit-dependent GTPase A, partial [Tepidisphaeraceae bacterium]